MPVEIERKYLVANDAWRREAGEGSRIQQGYIVSQDNCNVRVRIRCNGRCTLTTKMPRSGLSRYEFEHDIDLVDAENLMSLCGSRVVDKRRFKVEYAGHVWEVDVYDGANKGLVVAEIELDREDREFKVPDWIGSDVTGIKRYQNSQLSREPYASWEPVGAEAL